MKRAAVDERRSPVALRSMFWNIDRWRHSSAYMKMSLEQQGAYRNLLDEMWLRGGTLTNDPKMLARACGDPQRWQRVRAVVMQWFRLRGKTWHHKTLAEVRAQSQRRADKQRAYRDRLNARNGNAPGNGAGNAGGYK